MSRVRVLSAVQRFLAIAALCAFGACSESRPTAPAAPAGNDFLIGGSASPTLIECSSKETLTQSAVLDAAGGTVSIGGTSVVFPSGALPGATTVTLTIPASKYLEIDIETDGAKYFATLGDVDTRPIVTIDYTRCTRSDVLWKSLTAWYIDAESKALLEEMSSTDNKLTRSVTFRADHFSGYAIAF